MNVTKRNITAFLYCLGLRINQKTVHYHNFRNDLIYGT